MQGMSVAPVVMCALALTVSVALGERGVDFSAAQMGATFSVSWLFAVMAHLLYASLLFDARHRGFAVFYAFLVLCDVVLGMSLAVSGTHLLGAQFAWAFIGSTSLLAWGLLQSRA